MVGRAVAGCALWLAVVPAALVAPAAAARHAGVTVDEEGVIHQRAGADEFDLELLQAGARARVCVPLVPSCELSSGRDGGARISLSLCLSASASASLCLPLWLF